MLKKNNTLLLLSLLILFVLSMSRFSGGVDFWFSDIFSNFPVQYTFLSLVLLFACLWQKKPVMTIISIILLLVNGSVMIETGTSVQAAGPEYNRKFNVYSANINWSNRDYVRIHDVLSESGADILLLLEVTEDNVRPLQPLMSRYPYSVSNLNLTSTRTGAVLLSKFPILDNEVIKYSEFGNILIAATLEIHDKKIRFYGTHFPRPEMFKQHETRSGQIMELAHKISEDSLPVIVSGDFNATPYSPVFKEFIKISGLIDSSDGWDPSWPAEFPLLWIPIDHILVSPGIFVHERTTGPFLGSDHYPVLAELSIG